MLEEGALKTKVFLDNFNYGLDSRTKPTLENISRFFLSPIGIYNFTADSQKNERFPPTSERTNRFQRGIGACLDATKMGYAGCLLQQVFIYACNVL